MLALCLLELVTLCRYCFNVQLFVAVMQEVMLVLLCPERACLLLLHQSDGLCVVLCICPKEVLYRIGLNRSTTVFAAQHLRFHGKKHDGPDL